MKYEGIKALEEEKFRRLNGVKRRTFEKMLEILSDSEKRRNQKEVENPSCS